MFWILATALHTIFIFAIIPHARTIQHYGELFWRASSVSEQISLLTTLSLLGMIRISGVLSHTSPRLLLQSACASIVVLLAASTLCFFWVEWAHIGTYGLLAFFAFRAAAALVPSSSLLRTGLLYCAIIGILDEVVQGITPGRFFDIRDIFLNLLGTIWGVTLSLPYLHNEHGYVWSLKRLSQARRAVRQSE